MGDLRLNIRYGTVYPIGNDQPYSLPEVLYNYYWLQLIHNDHPDRDRYSLEGDTCCFEIVALYVEDLMISMNANLDLYCDELDEMNEHIGKDLLASFDVGKGAHLLIVAGMHMVDSTTLFKGKDIDLLEDKYLSFELNIFKVPLQNLKNVKVMPFCSRTRSFDAIKLHQFLKFLLEPAINPDKLVVVLEHKNCIICSTNTSNLMKHLLAFPTNTFKTSTLSKDWKCFWTSIKNIVYDTEEYGRLDSSAVHNSFPSRIMYYLSLAIKMFSLNFVFKYDDGLSYFHIIDKWLELSVNKKLEDLRLKMCYRIVYPTGHDQPYSLPEVLCSSSSIIKLKCNNKRI
ncbi:hypothetical protein H5410_060735 [Solanum commersonii]|uniref:Uncharacterized protein n=1 Tax=Solanum commersonii TaxID=4109 RepID=A0A9J5W698_SOLCO|nr:hypothetical protein H5410_060735 [Solanum commersonii]